MFGNYQRDDITQKAKNDLKEFFKKNEEEVFYSRQIEIKFEDEYYHWITNRALNELMQERFMNAEKRKLKTGNEILLLWNKNYRYYKREARKLIEIVQELSNPNMGASIGTHCELLVLEGFAKFEFVMKGRHVNEYLGKTWKESGHNMDYIFCKDDICYGIEIKNTLGYMDKDEIDLKIKLCKYLNVKPVFIVRMLPKSWINEIIEKGGFALILKYQLYPQYHKEFAEKVRKELKLPVDSPKALKDETIHRFLKWHKKHVK
jgi:hypothetical protein